MVKQESNIDCPSIPPISTKDTCDCTIPDPLKNEDRSLEKMENHPNHENTVRACGEFRFAIEEFRATATSLNPITDKVTTHSYQIMYGIFLNSMRGKKIKFLEIGLGCNMGYGPGASAQLWKTYLHKDSEIWFADYDDLCVQKYSEQLKNMNIKTLIGSQDNIETLNSWIQKSGGNFDVIVDDGGHQNTQIKISFDNLWPTIKKGGFYFIEDMHMAYDDFRTQNRLENGLTVPDHIFQWTRSLLVGGDKPIDLQSIFCQYEACVLKKTD